MTPWAGTCTAGPGGGLVHLPALGWGDREEEDGMGLGQRLAMIFRSKANRALDRAEDPRETLDYSYEKQLELLQKTRRGLADVATSRKRIELQLNQINANGERLQEQARAALGAGQEDLAREALSRRSALETSKADLIRQHQQLKGQEDGLTTAVQRLQSKVEAFRTQKETIKATYTAAEAQTRIGEAFSGISEEMADVGLAMDRARNKTEELQARAGAVDDLMASGALNDPTASLSGGDDIQRQLDALSSGSDVDSELARLKGEIEGGPAQQELEGNR